MMYLNFKQELGILKLYSEEIISLLECAYVDEFLVKGLRALLKESHLNELRDSSDDKRSFAEQLWKDLLDSPLIKNLYETVLNFVRDVNQNLHKCISMTSENVRTCSFGLILQHVDEILELLDVAHTINKLQDISKNYELICIKLKESLEEVENELIKKKIVIRTIPFFGKMACMDLLKALYDSQDGSKFVEKIQPGFSHIYELEDADRGKPQSLVKFYPLSELAILQKDTQGVIDVDLSWDDLPKTGMKKCLFDTLEHRSFNEKPIVLRSYQKELVKHAIEGKNCIVAAPTGSGKTIVAAYVVKEHLFERFDKNLYYKVLFLVNSTAILQQQTSVIKTVLNHKFQIGCTSGLQSDPVHLLIETKDVLICTPQIIVNLLLDAENGLNQGRAPFSLSKFSLIVFDECHNTKKLSPYAELMQRYHTAKFSGRHALPQIVGLTASLGVGGKSKNLDEAVEHIVTICAKLDCRIISRVKEYKDEMEEFVKRASDEIYKVEDSCRIRQQFLQHLIDFMCVVEEKSKQVLERNNLERTSICVPNLMVTNPYRIREIPNPSSENYEHFISCHLGTNIPESCVGSEIKKTITLYFEVLQSCSRAMTIHENFSSAIALGVLRSDMEELIMPADLKMLWQVTFSNLQMKTTNSSEMIDQVVELLKEKSEQCSDFRAIIFVKTRAGTTFLSNIINQHDALKALGIRSEALFGTNRQNCTEKINKSEVTEIIERFTNGVSKVLVTTSTAEEGLDILKCNLVIKYNYVTNEIGHVQRRGRGRAADARCVLITTCSLQQSREESNCMKEQLMEEALEYLKPYILEQKVDAAINDEIDSIRRRRALKAERYKRSLSHNYSLCCSKCDFVLCKSDEINVYRENLYLVTRPGLRSDVRVSELAKEYIEENKYAGVALIYCKQLNCGNELGRIHRIEEVEFPSLSAKAIVVKYVENNTEKRVKKKKWSLICDMFQPSPLRDFHFANMKKNSGPLTFKTLTKSGIVQLNS